MAQMITYKFKSETKNGHIFFEGNKIEARKLKKEIADKSGSKEQELVLNDEQTGQRYKDGDSIKSYSVVVVERVSTLSMYSTVHTASTSQQNSANSSVNSIQPVHEILDALTDKARFFMIKSSNEENIRIAKEHSIWATTFINQRKLKDAFDQSPNILLFFKANSSNNLQGLARMETRPSDIPNKSVWVGVDTIKLGGNFGVKWISKSIVPGSKFQNEINPLTKQYVSRSGDVQEIDRALGKKMAGMFQLPPNTQITIGNRAPMNKAENVIDTSKILGLEGGSAQIQTQPKIQPIPTFAPAMFMGWPGYPPFFPPGNFGPFVPNGQPIQPEKPKENKTKKKNRSEESHNRSDSSDSESSSSQSSHRRKRKRSRDQKRKKTKKDKKSKRDRSRSRERSRGRKKEKSRKHR